MSGGAYNYMFLKIEDFADDIACGRNTLQRKAFVELLHKVADAAKAIEWHDSGDSGLEAEQKAITECLAYGSDNADRVQRAQMFDQIMDIVSTGIDSDRSRQ